MQCEVLEMAWSGTGGALNGAKLEALSVGFCAFFYFFRNTRNLISQCPNGFQPCGILKLHNEIHGGSSRGNTLRICSHEQFC